MPEYEVRAQRILGTSFKILAASRGEAEDAIAEKLRSDKELVWTDDSTGIKVSLSIGHELPKRPRRKYSLNDGE
jgi:hypothetical protein